MLKIHIVFIKCNKFDSIIAKVQNITNAHTNVLEWVEEVA